MLIKKHLKKSNSSYILNRLVLLANETVTAFIAEGDTATLKLKHEWVPDNTVDPLDPSCIL